MTNPERDDSLAMALGDLDTYEAEVAKLNRQVEELAAENARLRLQREKAEDERDRLQARLDTATAHVEELRGQRDEARRMLRNLTAVHDRMRPVVEAVPALYGFYRIWQYEVGTFDPGDELAATGIASLLDIGDSQLLESAAALVESFEPVLDAWRAAQADAKAPTDRPSATQSQDQGADDGAGTEGSQAQGGAQGGAWPRDVIKVDPSIPPGEIRIVDTETGERLGTLTFAPDDPPPFGKPAFGEWVETRLAPADPAGLDAAIDKTLAEDR